jgi:hypothetical protein
LAVQIIFLLLRTEKYRRSNSGSSHKIVAISKPPPPQFEGKLQQLPQ